LVLLPVVVLLTCMAWRSLMRTSMTTRTMSLASSSWPGALTLQQMHHEPTQRRVQQQVQQLLQQQASQQWQWAAQKAQHQ
jgi:hypothetical protein